MKYNRLFVLIDIVIPALLLLGVVGYCIHHTPWPADTPAFPMTVSMTKLDADYKTLRTCEITITGTRMKYLSGTVHQQRSAEAPRFFLA